MAEKAVGTREAEDPAAASEQVRERASRKQAGKAFTQEEAATLVDLAGAL